MHIPPWCSHLISLIPQSMDVILLSHEDTYYNIGMDISRPVELVELV